MANATLHRQHSSMPGGSSGPSPRATIEDLRTSFVPFEFKTGKEFWTHRAQVSLYLLLMEEVYREPVEWGLLWNIHQPAMQAIQRKHSELAPLMSTRNHLAAYLAQQCPSPPPMLNDDWVCQKCPQRVTCALYHKAVEGGSEESAGMGASFVKDNAHLWPQHCDFLKHWLMLVDLEEAASKVKRNEVWSITGEERQALGGCIAGLCYAGSMGSTETSEGLRYLYKFSRAAETPTRSSAPPPQNQVEAAGVDIEDGRGAVSLVHSGFSIGDMVLLGVDGFQVAVARVFVHEILEDHIVVLARRPLQLERYVTRYEQARLSGEVGVLNQQQEEKEVPPAVSGGCSNNERPSIKEMGVDSGRVDNSAAAARGCSPGGTQPCCWRIDRDEVVSTFTQLRTNVMQLFPAQTGPVVHLRQLIVDLKEPTFKPLRDTRQQAVSGEDAFNFVRTAPQALDTGSDSTPSSLPLNIHTSQGLKYLEDHRGDMNEDQISAIQKVLEMQDYVLILGMPGTGKTTTLVHAIKALVACGCRILISSYTNSAVDNILLKLVPEGVHFLRVGRAAAVHPALRDHVPGGKLFDITSTSGIREMMASIQVVACPALSVHHLLLSQSSFDVVLLDEAGQINLPASLGPIMKAHRFVLVGDHMQLSPLVLSKAAKEQGLDVSLFKRLSEAHPQSVVELRHQYRMAADIMLLSNTLVYKGRLECGSDQVANRVLTLPNIQEGALASYPQWLQHVLQPCHRVVFLDTCQAGAWETSVSEGVCNLQEVEVVGRIVSALVGHGVKDKAIALMSPYKAQVHLLQQWLLQRDLTAAEALTVDKYQGRDKDCVILSLVRSNEGRLAGKLLADWQRINVALTRARCKLLIVGDSRTVGTLDKVRDLIQLCRERGWSLTLPGAVDFDQNRERCG